MKTNIFRKPIVASHTDFNDVNNKMFWNIVFLPNLETRLRALFEVIEKHVLSL